MNPRERPGKRCMVFPPSWQGERFTAAEEEAQERLQEAEAQRAPAQESPRMRMWHRLANEYPRSHCCQASLVVQSGAGVYCDHCAQPRLA